MLLLLKVYDFLNSKLYLNNKRNIFVGLVLFKILSEYLSPVLSFIFHLAIEVERL